jgi:hypothetical protein
VLTDQAPVGAHQNQDGETARRQILLVAKVLIRGDERGKPFRLGSAQSFAVLEALPSALKGGRDFVAWQRTA